MNRWIGIGNLATDPEIRTAQSGTQICTFRIAVNRRFANAQGVREVDFIPVVCFKQTAELCSKYLQKGRKVAVEGSIQTRSYEAQDGSKRYVTEIIADNVEFLSSRGESKESGGVNHITQSVMNQARETFGSEFVEVDDELPF
jgi:single-strand DNA-binding protein